MVQSLSSPKQLARIAGVLYLFVGIFGGFAEGFVDPKMYVAGNAAATAGNVVALATGIICLNAIFQFEALRIATDNSYAAAFGAAGSNALVLLLLDTQHYGTLSAQVFFGLWLVPLGYLAYKSGLFPKWLGILLIVGGLCYVLDLLAAFLVPGVSKDIHAFVVIPSAVAEISMVLYLLVVGVRTALVLEKAPG
jgi:hypothetical protein